MPSSVTVKLLGDNRDLKASLDESSGLLSGFGGAIGKGIVGAGAGAATGFALGFKGALDREGLTDALAAEFDLTESEAQARAALAGKIYGKAFGDSLDQVLDVQSSLEQSGLGVFGDDLDAVTSQVLTLAEVMEQDTGEVIQVMRELLEDDLVGSGQEAIDILTRGFQAMPKEIRGELLAATAEYGDFFAQLGFDGEAAIGGLAKAAQEGGVFGIDKFGDALKEATIRMTDMSEGSGEAFESMGLDQEEFAEALLTGGEVANDAFAEIVKGLQNIEDPVEQATASIALFGTPLEDLGTAEIPEFLRQLGNLNEGMYEVDGAAADLANTASSNLSTDLEMLKRRGFQALTDFVNNRFYPAFLRVRDWWKENWPEISRIGTQVLGTIEEKGEQLVEKFQEYWPQIRDTMSRVFTWLKDDAWPVAEEVFTAVADFVADLVEKFREHWPQIRATISDFVDWLKDDAWPVVRRIFKAINKFVKDEILPLFRKHWPKIKEIVVSAIEAIEAGIRRFITIVQGLWETFGSTLTSHLKTTWDNMKLYIDGILDVIHGIFKAFKALFEGDWGALWDAVKQIFSGFWTAFKASFQQAWNQLKTTVKLAWDGVKAAVSAPLTAITTSLRDWISARITQVTGWGSRILNVFKTAFEKAKDGVIGAISGALGIATWLTDWVTARYTQITGWGETLFTKAKETFGRFVDGVKDALGAVADWVKTNVIDPIISGINSLIETINLIPFVDIPKIGDPTVPVGASAAVSAVGAQAGSAAANVVGSTASLLAGIRNAAASASASTGQPQRFVIPAVDPNLPPDSYYTDASGNLTSLWSNNTPGAQPFSTTSPTQRSRVSVGTINITEPVDVGRELATLGTLGGIQ